MIDIGVDLMHAAGVMFRTPTGKILFLRRSASGDHGGEWGLPGGGIEEGETTLQAVMRECLEEISYRPLGLRRIVDRRTSKEGVDFTTFECAVEEPFKPKLNIEHTDYRWATATQAPQPLHPGVAATLGALSKPKPGSVRTAPGVRPNLGLQAAYRRRLDLLVGQMHNSVLYWVSAAYKANTPEVAALAMDASPAAVLQALMKKLGRYWQKRFNDAAPELAAYFAQSVNKRTAAALREILKKSGISVEFRLTRTANDVLQATTGENVALIKSIAQKYLTDVEGAVLRSVTTGRDLKSLVDAIGDKVDLKRIGLGRKPGESDKSLVARMQRRVALIARDQNNKATATLTRVRQAEAGITEALWMHSHGGKEPRPTHVANDGKRYNIAEGWYDPAVGKHIFPGEEVNCRCFSKSIIPGL